MLWIYICALWLNCVHTCFLYRWFFKRCFGLNIVLCIFLWHCVHWCFLACISIFHIVLFLSISMYLPCTFSIAIYTLHVCALAMLCSSDLFFCCICTFEQLHLEIRFFETLKSKLIETIVLIAHHWHLLTTIFVCWLFFCSPQQVFLRKCAKCIWMV